MKIATWNVNSIRARHDLLLDWLRLAEPDVLCLQETKVLDEHFPTDELLRLGYETAMVGQKSYNGVAIIARQPLSDVRVGLDADPAPGDARALRATVEGTRIFCVYVPNGKAVDSPSFEIKLRWLEALATTVQNDPGADGQVVVCGDFNVAPESRDTYDPEKMQGQLHFHPREHAALRTLTDLPLCDALRLHHQQGGLYTWWDYRAGAFRRDLGLRIDLILASQSMARRCTACEIDRVPRTWSKPSDHTPVVATFRDEA